MTSRIIIIDDHPLMAYGLCSNLRQAGFEAEPVEPLTVGQVVDEVTDRHPDLILLDLDLPIESGGLGLVEPLSHIASVAVLTGSLDQYLWASSIARGARVVLTKTEPLDDIIDQIGRLLKGHDVKPQQRADLAGQFRRLQRERADLLRGFDQLSPRESVVLAGLMAGLSPRSLAQRDFVSIQTVRSQIKSLLQKLEVNSQLAAVARAHEAGWSADTASRELRDGSGSPNSAMPSGAGR